MKSKTGTVVLALLVAACFGGGGFVGFSGLEHQLNGWWQARGWQAVPATVIDAALKTSSGETMTHQATVRYRYVFEGRSHEGTQVGFSRGFDNVGSWQSDHYRRLIAAKREGRPIEVWVDPERPERSVVDRNIRWAMIAFALPFATVFPLISISALWFVFRTLRTPAQEFAAPPKLERNASEIRSDARNGTRILWAFAILWGMIAFPIAFIVVPEQFGRSWIWLMVMLFPLVGLALIWIAAARTIRQVRHGEVTLALDPTEPRLGESMTVRAEFTRVPPAGEYAVSLLCERVDTRGDDTHYRTVWQQERVMQIGGLHAATSFSLPAHLPPSQPHTDIYHRWRVLLSFPDKKDERGFDMVIGPAREGVGTDAAAGEHTDPLSSDGIARPVPESVAVIVDESSRLKISYAANSFGSAGGILLFALIFGGVGTFLLFGIADGALTTLMGSVFALIGIALVGAGVYALTHRRIVEISRGRLRVENHWLLRSTQQECAVADIRNLASSIRGTTTVGSKRYDHYQIKALLRDGREIALASDVRDAGIALTLKQLLERHLARQGSGSEPGARAGADQPPASPAQAPSPAPYPFSVDRSPAQEAYAARMRKRIVTGIKVVGVPALLAMFWWDFFGEEFFGKDTERTVEEKVEAPRKAGANTPGSADRALFHAIEQDNAVEAIASALARGANVHATDEWGATPLLMAARSGNPEAVRALIRAGSNIDFSVAKDNEYRGRTPLMDAATSGNGETVAVLLEAGADTQAFESHGWSALHYAAHRGNLEALRAFHRRHVDLDLRSPESRGETPLMIAARFGRLDSIEELIKLGADARAKDRYGENVYSWARFFDQSAAMEALSAYQ